MSDDALATRDEFLAIVSHDLRNLLHGIVGSAALVENGAPETDLVDQVVTHARRIQRAGARMNRLIGDLVDVASIEAGALAVTREVGDVTTVVTEAVDIFQLQAATAGISVAAEIVPPVSLAAFDAARILQVLTNLLSNAIKFTPAQGRVAVRVERFGDDIRFAVSDTGDGIATDKLETVFGRFLQVARNDQTRRWARSLHLQGDCARPRRPNLGGKPVAPGQHILLYPADPCCRIGCVDDVYGDSASPRFVCTANWTVLRA